MAVQTPLKKGSEAFVDEIDPSVDTLNAKIQVSANNRVLGRVTSGAGAHEELTAADIISLITSGSSTLENVVFLLSTDETDSSEHNTSTSESSALKTYNLAANSYDYILIEAVVQSRVEQDASTKCDFTWRIKEGGTTRRTYVQRVIALATAGTDSGGRYVDTVSTVIAGGQGSTTALTITVQPNLSNAATGALVQAFRVYGIRDVSFPAIGSVEVAKAGTLVGTRPRINLIEGSNVTLTVTDNSGSDRVDVTVAASGGGGGSPSVISPSQITSTQNDYAPTGWADATLIRLSGDASFRKITGFSAETSGEIKTLVNVGSYCLYIAPEHTGSSAANRLSYQEEIILWPGGCCQIYYDGTLSRWGIVTNPAPAYRVPTKATYYDEGLARASTAAAADNALDIWGSITVLEADASSSLRFSSLALTTGATTSGGAGIMYPHDHAGAQTGSAHIVAKTHIRTPATLGDATNNYYYFLRIADSPYSGFWDQNSSVGIYYRYSDNSGKWFLRSRSSGGTNTEVDSGITFAVDTEYELQVSLNFANDEATFWINGVVVGRITTNLPGTTNVGWSQQLEKTAGSSSRTVNVFRFIGAAIAP